MVISIGQEAAGSGGTQWQGAESLAKRLHFLLSWSSLQLFWCFSLTIAMVQLCYMCVLFHNFEKTFKRRNTSHRSHQIEHNKNLGLRIDKERACTWFTIKLYTYVYVDLAPISSLSFVLHVLGVVGDSGSCFFQLKYKFQTIISRNQNDNVTIAAAESNNEAPTGKARGARFNQWACLSRYEWYCHHFLFPESLINISMGSISFFQDLSFLWLLSWVFRKGLWFTLGLILMNLFIRIW